MLGRPSLEHSRVDLTAIPEAAAGDEVVIIGSQGQAELSLHEVMAHQGMERDLAAALEVRSSVRRAYST
jgi:alanine racemase